MSLESGGDSAGGRPALSASRLREPVAYSAEPRTVGKGSRRRVPVNSSHDQLVTARDELTTRVWRVDCYCSYYVGVNRMNTLSTQWNDNSKSKNCFYKWHKELYQLVICA